MDSMDTVYYRPESNADYVVGMMLGFTKTFMTMAGISLVVECTQMNAGIHVPFDAAEVSAKKHFDKPDEILYVIDVGQARVCGIRPIPSRIKTDDGWRVDLQKSNEEPQEIVAPEEVETLVCTNGIRQLLDFEKYSKIYQMFLKKDMYHLALVIESMLKEMYKYKDIIYKKEREIESLHKNIENLEMQLSEQEEVITKLNEEKDIFKKVGRKYDMKTLKSMKDMYENGESFTKIGDTLGMDKSTVKRKLIQMGTNIRSN